MDKIFNKNYLIILISIFYALGIVSYANNFEIILASSLLIFFIFGIIFFKIEPKIAIIVFLAFIIGNIRTEKSYNIEDFLENVYAKNVSIEGRIVSSKNITQNQRTRFYLDVKNINLNGKDFNNIKSKILINTNYTNALESIIQGDIIKIKGSLKPPKNNVNPYQFNYKKYLLNNNCKNILYADEKSIQKIQEPKLSKNMDENWYYIIHQFELTRNKIIIEHSKNIKSPKLELLSGIVFGNEAVNPDDKIKENFQNSGLLHLLAASGLNVALIYGIWWQIAMLLKIPFKPAIFVGGIFVIFYTFMTGFPPSILRASSMLLFILFGKLINRDAKSTSLLFFVGFLILLFNPKMIFDIGFELSFSVTLGLIICTNVIIEKFEKQNKKYIEKHKDDNIFKKHFFYMFSPVNVISIISVPLIAQIWVIPLQMHYFNNLAPFSILANIAVVPFIGILSFIGFISSIIALIPILNSPVVFIFDSIANPLLGLLIKISEFFSSFKYSLITTTGLNFYQIFGSWIIILLLTLNIKNNFKNKKELTIFLISFIIFLSCFIKFDYFSKNLEITMFDVENADCFLIKTPENKYIMIDCGKKIYKNTTDAKMIINPYIKNRGIKKLDALIITHFDIDHSGGSLDIIKNNKIEKIYIQSNEETSLISKELMQYMKNNNLDYKIANNNEIIYKEKNLQLKTLKSNISNSENEDSIITLLTYKNKNILFMADCSTISFEKIKNNLPNKIDIIKIGHHGAKNTVNNNMLKRINPDIALISAGGEKYKHPDSETLFILKDNYIKTITTKNYNCVKVVLKKNKTDFEYYQYDSSLNKFKKILFDNNSMPFHKTKYFEELSKNL